MTHCRKGPSVPPIWTIISLPSTWLRAIEAATELQRMPGMSAEAFAETLDFWRRVRDHAGSAALDSLGGSSTLAEALVTFRLLNNLGDE